jgi:hypothetical protein
MGERVTCRHRRAAYMEHAIPRGQAFGRHSYWCPDCGARAYLFQRKDGKRRRRRTKPTMSDEPKDDGFEEWWTRWAHSVVQGRPTSNRHCAEAAYHAGRNSRDAEVEELQQLYASADDEVSCLSSAIAEKNARIAELEKALALEQVESHRLRHLRTTGQ